MRRERAPLVLFRAAAGPARGFGHLVRCGVLADALGARRELSLRGTDETIASACGLGWTVHTGSPRLLETLDPDLLVIDDPDADSRASWIARARNLQVPVVIIHDGDRDSSATDLRVDGSPLARSGRPGSLIGPRFAILDPALSALRQRAIPRFRRHVLIALGGGDHSRRFGAAIARAIQARCPALTIEVAAGFTGAVRPALPAGCQWLDAPSGLAEALATAEVVVTGGGLTLLEACVLRTPIVALAVVPAQRAAIAALAARGALIDVSRRTVGAAAREAAAAVAHLSVHAAAARQLGRRAGQIADGGGVWRVADRILQMLAFARERGASRAA